MNWALGLWVILQGLSLLGVLNYWRHLPVDRQEEAPEGVVVLLSVRDDWDGGTELIERLKAQSARFRLVIATSGGCAAADALEAREAAWVQIVRAGVSPTPINRRGADLMGADLRGADLRGTDFRSAYLIGADLRGADLAYADLIGTDLRDADVRGTHLAQSIFLTQMQINATHGDAATTLPNRLARPTHWS